MFCLMNYNCLLTQSFLLFFIRPFSVLLKPSTKGKSLINLLKIMSIDPVRERFWQTTAKSTIEERCKAIFNQELLSDVKFVFHGIRSGSESMKIAAHKFVLAVSSPVFYAMFYGPIAESKDCVEIYDCEYASFLEVLSFIYTNEANLTPENVMQVLYLAKKYLLPSLANKCSVYLQENMDESSVFHVLQHAQKYEDKDLLEHCWKVIENETEDAIKSDDFMTIERPILEELVQKDSLNVKEVELFKAVDCWAGRQCKKRGLVAGGSVKRKILGEKIIKGIRFPVMKEEEFESVLDCGILTQKETCDFVKFYNSVPDTSLDFCKVKRKVSPYRVSRFPSLAYRGSWEHSSECYDMIVLSFDNDINLCTVRLFGSRDNEFRVALCIKVEENKMVIVDTKEAKFLSRQVESKIGNYPGFDIEFEPPIALKANIRYVFRADINGPPSWFGEGGQCWVNHLGVNFYFDNPSRKVSTCVERGQFSEFLFTLD